MKAIWVMLTMATLATATERPQALRLVSYNIRHAAGLDGRLDPARIGAVLAAARPDLVALQEVDHLSSRTQRQDQTALIAAAAGLGGVFGQAIPLGGGGYGNAVLSRLRWREAEVLPLPVGGEPRCVVVSLFDLPGMAPPLAFLATHLDFEDGDAGDQSRQRQVAAIIAAADALPAGAPTIVAGDLNCPPGSAPLAKLTAAGFVEASAGIGPSFPANQPTVQIDHIFVRPGAYDLKLHGGRVIDEPVASDHRPIVVDLELLPTTVVRPRAWSRLG